MRRTLILVLLVAVSVSAQTPKAAQYPIQAVPLSQVTLTDGFLKTKVETNRTVTIPAILAQNEKTGRVDNLRKGAGLMPGDYVGRRFNDTDIYKIVEAASYSLASHPDPVLSKSVEVTVVTAVVFSVTATAALLVTTGASLTPLIVMVSCAVSLKLNASCIR